MTTQAASEGMFADLPVNTVHIWQARLAAPPWPEATLWSVLSDAEHVAAGQFAFPRDQRAFVLRRGLLRMLLAGYLTLPPATLQFVTSHQGKPALSPLTGQPQLSFNLSQSGDLVLYAVARQPVGVDVEYMGAEHDVAALAEVFFTPAERAWLAVMPDDQQVAEALRLWTCKEAYVKATGAGLTAALRQMSMVHAGTLIRRLGVAVDATTEQCWSLRTFAPAPGYVAAVAYQWSGEQDFALRICSLTDDGSCQ